MLSILRRQVQITTSPAPALRHDAHIDVSVDDPQPPTPPTPRPAVVDVEPVTEPCDFHPDTLIPFPPDRVDQRAPIDRGTCYHDLHAEIPGRGRMGLLVDGDVATLLSCPYTNLDGR